MGNQTKKQLAYEFTPTNRNLSSNAVSKLKNVQLNKFNSSYLLWHLIKRHKFGLIVSYSLVLSLYHFAPQLPEIVFNLIAGRL